MGIFHKDIRDFLGSRVYGRPFPVEKKKRKTKGLGAKSPFLCKFDVFGGVSRVYQESRTFWSAHHFDFWPPSIKARKVTFFRQRVTQPPTHKWRKAHFLCKFDVFRGVSRVYHGYRTLRSTPKFDFWPPSLKTRKVIFWRRRVTQPPTHKWRKA